MDEHLHKQNDARIILLAISMLENKQAHVQICIQSRAMIESLRSFVQVEQKKNTQA